MLLCGNVPKAQQPVTSHTQLLMRLIVQSCPHANNPKTVNVFEERNKQHSNLCPVSWWNIRSTEETFLACFDIFFESQLVIQCLIKKYRNVPGASLCNIHLSYAFVPIDIQAGGIWTCKLNTPCGAYCSVCFWLVSASPGTRARWWRRSSTWALITTWALPKTPAPALTPPPTPRSSTG